MVKSVTLSLLCIVIISACGNIHTLNVLQVSIATNSSSIQFTAVQEPPGAGLESLTTVSSNWVITDYVTVENDLLVLIGNITIKAGGTLLLRNTTVRFEGPLYSLYSIEVLSGGNLTIVDNSVVTSSDSEYVRWCLTAHNNSAIHLRDSCFSHAGYGILMTNEEEYADEGNTSGLWINTENAEVQRCAIDNNAYGLLLVQANKAQILDNIITNSYKDGLLLIRSNHSSIIGNNISSNGDIGLHIYGSQDNLITHNIISENVWVGLFIDSPTRDCSIWLNTFSHNAQNSNIDARGNAYDASGQNSWDNGSHGNWWGDYNGPDQDKNGIGEDQYFIHGKGSWDRYPLIRYEEESLITIDGQMDDWATFSPQLADPVDESEYFNIDKVWMVNDSKHLFFRVLFVESYNPLFALENRTELTVNVTCQLENGSSYLINAYVGPAWNFTYTGIYKLSSFLDPSSLIGDGMFFPWSVAMDGDATRQNMEFEISLTYFGFPAKVSVIVWHAQKVTHNHQALRLLEATQDKTTILDRVPDTGYMVYQFASPHSPIFHTDPSSSGETDSPIDTATQAEGTTTAQAVGLLGATAIVGLIFIRRRKQ